MSAVREHEAREILDGAATLLFDAVAAQARGQYRTLANIHTKGFALTDGICQQSWGVGRESRGALVRALRMFFLSVDMSGPVMARLRALGFHTRDDYAGALNAAWAYSEELTAARVLLLLGGAPNHVSSGEWFDDLVSCLIGGRVFSRLLEKDPYLAVSRSGLEAGVLRLGEGVTTTLDEVVGEIEDSLRRLEAR